LDAGKKQIVLLGELTAGDSVYLRAGQSTAVKTGNTINDELIRDLTVAIDGAGGRFYLTGTEDDLSYSECTLAFSNASQVQAGNTYTLDANHPSLGKATARIAIPAAFTVTVSDTVSADFHMKSCIQLHVTVDDLPEKNYYVLEVLQQPFTVEPAFLFNGQWFKQSEHWELYDSLFNAGMPPEERMDSFAIRMFTRIPSFSDDDKSEHLLNGKFSEPAKRILLDDKSFNGSRHASTLYIPKDALGMQYPGIGMFTILQVKSVSADYFHYLKAYEQLGIFSGLPDNRSPVRVNGNVQNGVGMVGGVFKRQFRYIF